MAHTRSHIMSNNKDYLIKVDIGLDIEKEYQEDCQRIAKEAKELNQLFNEVVDIAEKDGIILKNIDTIINETTPIVQEGTQHIIKASKKVLERKN